MNSTWNNNLDSFKNRFPQLAELIKPELKAFSQPDFWNVIQAKDGSITAEENGLRLHSTYNPEREAQNTINSKIKELENAKSAIFLGFGLGYSPLALCKIKKDIPLILVEPDINHFLGSLYLLDWTLIFKNPNLILALSCTPEQTSILINQYGINDSVFFANPNHMAHAKPYFDVIQTLIERNRQKENINQATLKKFGPLWTRNCKKNATIYSSLTAVTEYKNTANKPFLLLAAGPSLENVLPHLNELKQKTTIVCVDTSLRACIRVGIEPDFIVLTDPQFWAYKHIAGIKSPSSVLITELAVVPSVFRFECKKIVVCNSQVPMAKDFCSDADKKGDLGAGGSVASSAFNFCILCGAKEIYVAGLDLAFPHKQTHIKGSTFEEACHSASSKINPAQTQGLPLLFGGNACLSKDYNNNDVVTDQRMKMFAWWFENRITELSDVKVYTFGPNGQKIPGITPAKVSDLLSK